MRKEKGTVQWVHAHVQSGYEAEGQTASSWGKTTDSQLSATPIVLYCVRARSLKASRKAFECGVDDYFRRLFLWGRGGRQTTNCVFVSLELEERNAKSKKQINPSLSQYKVMELLASLYQRYQRTFDSNGSIPGQFLAFTLSFLIPGARSHSVHAAVDIAGKPNAQATAAAAS